MSLHFLSPAQVQLAQEFKHYGIQIHSYSIPHRSIARYTLYEADYSIPGCAIEARQAWYCQLNGFCANRFSLRWWCFSLLTPALRIGKGGASFAVFIKLTIPTQQVQSPEGGPIKDLRERK